MPQVTRKAGDGSGGGPKGPDPKWILVLELEEGGDLLQHLGDRLLVHVVLYAFHRDASSGAPPQLQQLFLARNREQFRGDPARQARREKLAAVDPLQDSGRRAGYLDYAEPGPLRVNAEDAEDSDLIRFRKVVDETTIQWLVRLTRNNLCPDSSFGYLGIVGRPPNSGLVRPRGLLGPLDQSVQGKLNGETAPVPKEVRMVHQGSELVDAFAQALIGPQLPQQGHHFALH